MSKRVNNDKFINDPLAILSIVMLQVQTVIDFRQNRLGLFKLPLNFASWSLIPRQTSAVQGMQQLVSQKAYLTCWEQPGPGRPRPANPIRC